MFLREFSVTLVIFFPVVQEKRFGKIKSFEKGFLFIRKSLHFVL